MAATLRDALDRLRAHSNDLRGRGVLHAAVFGSVARDEARGDSDIDVLIELDPDHPMGLFEYSGLCLYIEELFDGNADVANRRALKPLLRENILQESIDAF